MNDWSPLNVMKRSACQSRDVLAIRLEHNNRKGTGEPKAGPMSALLWVRELGVHYIDEQNCPTVGGPELAAKRKTVVKESRNWWSTAQLPMDRTCGRRRGRRGRVAGGTATTASRGRDALEH